MFKLGPAAQPLDTAESTWQSDRQSRSRPAANDSLVDSTRPLPKAEAADDPAIPDPVEAAGLRPIDAGAPAAWSASAFGTPSTPDSGAGYGGGTGGFGAGGFGTDGFGADGFGAGSPGAGSSGGAGAGGSSGWGGGPGGPGGPSGPGGPGGPYGPAEPAAKPNRRKMGSIVGIAAALVVLVGAGGIYYYTSSAKHTTTHTAAGDSKTKRKIITTIAHGPEHVVSVTPAAGAKGVNGGAAISVEFSEPLSLTSPMPELRPKIKGSWHVSGDTAEFVPAKGYWQHTKVKLTIPAGASGVQSNGGGTLATPVTEHFTTGAFSQVRLEQDLAQLGYLPLTWAPATGSPAALTDLNAQYIAAYDPPAGSYTWQTGYPSRLMSMWHPDASSNVLRGAVAAFQADHGLILDMIAENQDGLITSGPIGYRLWVSMFRALAKDATNKHGYTYAVASQHYPETLTVWHDGQVIFHHLANTGIPVSPTSVRTDPVYIRYQSQIMKGRNPDGTKYADQVYWVAYFHDGEAVHYFPRYTYGSQQSLGCVELPYGQAKAIWPYLTYGTLVTVTKA